VRLSLTYPDEGGTVMFSNCTFGSGHFAERLNTLLVLSYVIIMALYAGAFANVVRASWSPLAPEAERQRA
jgi:hypothetical protein